MANGSKQTNSDVIDKINFGKSFNILAQANAHNYVQSISKEDLIKKMFADSKSVKFSNEQDNKKFFTMLSNLLQSITTKGMTTYEIVTYIDTRTRIIDDIIMECSNKPTAQSGPINQERLDALKQLVNQILGPNSWEKIYSL